MTVPLAVAAALVWSSVVLPATEEPAAAARLAAAGLPALSWSSAQVEVSAFEGLEAVPLAALTSRLGPSDPRWDPWLRRAPEFFEAGQGQRRLWFPASAREPVMASLANAAAWEATGLPAPRLITGLILLGGCLFFGVMRVTALGWGRPLRWLALSLPTAAAGLILLTWGAPAAGAAGPTASLWRQHVWYQLAWPYGAVWDQAAGGQALTYLTYEAVDGRVVARPRQIPAPDDTWAQARRAEAGPANPVVLAELP